ALLPRDVGREHRRELDDGALVLPDREEPFGELGAERDLARVHDEASFEPMDGLVRLLELPGKHTGQLGVPVGPRRAGALEVALEGGRVARDRRARSRLDTRDELRELARCRALNPDDGDGLLVSMRRGLEPSSPALYASEERKSADPNAGI